MWKTLKRLQFQWVSFVSQLIVLANVLYHDPQKLISKTTKKFYAQALKVILQKRFLFIKQNTVLRKQMRYK